MTQLVLRELISDPAREMYGLEICTAAGLPSGTIHPILARLEKVGRLRSRWERSLSPSRDPDSVAAIQASTAPSTNALRLARWALPVLVLIVAAAAVSLAITSPRRHGRRR